TPVPAEPAGGGSALPFALGGAAVAALAVGGGLLLRRRAKTRRCAKELLAVARARAECEQHDSAMRRALTLAQEAWARVDAARKNLSDAKARLERWKQRLEFLDELARSGAAGRVLEGDAELAEELRRSP